MSALVLAAEDDPDIRSLIQASLQLGGFNVATAPDGEAAMEAARRLRPDLILLDVTMPRMDGYEVTRRLRRDAWVCNIPIIMLTAKVLVEDRIAGLEQGADDYVVKPFDPNELLARVHATLRRARENRSVSPLTGLPGNVRIQWELACRVEQRGPLAVLYADLDQFKPFNDRYGFLRGDEAIRAFADVVCAVAATFGDEDTFVGHIGGDDLLVITIPERAEPIAQAVIAAFDARVPELYDEADRRAGYIEVRDRQGEPHRYPLLSVSIGIATNLHRQIRDHRELVEVATEMKNYAKRAGHDRSSCEVDRRHGE